MHHTITNRKIRLAITGCGRISKNHFGAVEKHADNIEVVAVCDNDLATLEAHTRQYEVPGYQRFDQMLKHEQPDLVALCTPSGLHPTETITAARHGVSVMTEKPMATRWQDGLAMIRACDEAGACSSSSKTVATRPCSC